LVIRGLGETNPPASPQVGASPPTWAKFWLAANRPCRGKLPAWTTYGA